MNELTLTSTATFVTTSKKMDTAIKGYLSAINDGQKASVKMAKYLYDIKSKELWKNGDDFVSINDIAVTKFSEVCDVLGIGKQYGYKLTTAYGLKCDTEVLKDRLAPFTMSQVIELNTLSPTDIIVLVDEEMITPSMTTKAIRDVVVLYKKDENEDAPEEVNTESLDVGDTLPDEDETDNALHITYKDFECAITDDKDIKRFITLLEKIGYEF